MFALTGCLQEGSNDEGSNSGVVDLGFTGISTIQDLNANSIRLTWVAATSPQVVSYRVYEVLSDGELSALQALDKTNLAFVHSGLTLGSTHSYVVRAVDKNGNTDGNMSIKSIHTFGGANSVTATGFNTATVYFNSSLSFSSLSVYSRPLRNGSSGAWTDHGSTASSSSSFNVTGLKSGTTYEFRVRALNSSGLEDANPIVVTGQTHSKGFNPPIPLTEQYKGVILAQAFGLSPGSPAGTPQGRQITIVWNNFFPSEASSSYVLVRAIHGESVDTLTTTPCTPTTMTSCLVDTQQLTVGTNGTIVDTNVGAPPIKYDYVVSWLSDTNWPEELPSVDTAFRIYVPVPPDNMVLVHRDSVNYEQCTLMGKTPRPKENNRCWLGPDDNTPSTMWGAAPYNSGPGKSPLGLSSNYYDFGYNLFVDRHTLACNWTPGNGYNGGPYYGITQPNNAYGSIGDVYYNTDSGQCFMKTGAAQWTSAASAGAVCNYTGGNGYNGSPYVGIGAPNDSYGSNGAVYRRTDTNPVCYKKVNGTWLDATQDPSAYIPLSSLSTAQYGQLATNNPAANGGHRPPLVHITQWQSQMACNGQVAPYYGAKRLLRHREFIAAAAWPTFDGEPNSKTDQEMSNWENAASIPNPHTVGNGYRCNTNSASGIASVEAIRDQAFATPGRSLAGQDTTPGNGVNNMNLASFVIGSIETSGCMSRFGLQDHVGNVFLWNSDQLRCRKDALSQPTDVILNDDNTCVGVTSPLDSGNRDFQGFLFDGSSDGPGGDAGVTGWNIQGIGFGAGYFNTVLGLPMINNDGGSAVAISTFGSAGEKLHNDNYELYVNNGNSSRGLLVGGTWNYTYYAGRWSSHWYYPPTLSSHNIGVRCAVSAE